MNAAEVPFFDGRRNEGTLAAELEGAFRRVLAGGQYVLGAEVEQLERSCAVALGVRHAIGVSSGTDALLLALLALEIGPGDEVVCPVYTFFATAGAIARVGARPVFVDVDPVYLHLDPSAVAEVITARTRAVMPVHLFGRCAELGPILALARRHDLAVVEDAAQALGARLGGVPAGTKGTFGCFSFFPTKTLGALGDAGLLVTDDDELAERARTLRVHGARPKYHHALVGANLRMDALQAAFLSVKLPHLEAVIALRREVAERYGKRLAASGYGVPAERPGERATYNPYVVRVPGAGRRDALRAFLTGRGIGSEVYYPVPLHLQPCFSHLGGKAGAFPVGEAAARETLALPCFPGLSEREVDAVTAALLAFAEEG